MTIGKIEAADDHLRRIVGTKPILGVAELVWNAVDANATNVTIDIERTALGAVEQVTIRDTGHGFAADEIAEMFGAVGGSWKHHAPLRKTRGGARILHGAKGEGRWKAFSIGDRVIWQSVTAGAQDGPNKMVRLSMSDQHLDQYDWTGPSDVYEDVGTTVIIIAGSRQPDALLREQAYQDLTSVLALYLTQYPEVTVSYDGRQLEVSELIADRVEIDVPYENEYGLITLTVIEWEMNIQRALYLCDESGVTLHESNVGIHAPGFNFTAYVRWAGFRAHESLLPLADLDSDQVAPAVNAAREVLREHFRAKSAEDSKSVVQEWRDENVYPFASEPTDAIEMAGQALFNFVAVSAADAVNRIDDRQAKALSLRAMRVAVERDPSSIEFIMQEVLKLPEAKIDEFRTLLQQTSLTALVDAMRLVVGRLNFIAGLELLLFDPSHAPRVLERAHLHKMIENEPWLFGEEYATHVSDRSLTALLRTHLGLLGRNDFVSESVRDQDGKARRVDFLFGRALELNQARREHLVVEIKRPSVTIDRVEMDQIEDYALAVVSDGRFDLKTVQWDFVLVATELSDLAKSRIIRQDQPRGLMFEPVPGARIWLRQWSEIINECKHRLKFIRNKLEYDPDADQAVAYLRATYPDYVPEHLSSTAPDEATQDRADVEMPGQVTDLGFENESRRGEEPVIH